MDIQNMRKLFNALMLVLIAFTSASCHKELDVKDPVVSNDEMAVSGAQAHFSWCVEFSGAFQTGVELSPNENMTELRRVEAKKEGDKYVAVVDGLLMGTKYYYRIVVWNKLNNYVQEMKSFSTSTAYTVTLSCNPEAGGTVMGGGTYIVGDTCTVTAMPNEGYYFINWTLDDSVVSTAKTFSFEVTEAANYFANFELNDINDNDPLIYSINNDGVSVTVTGHVDGTGATGTLTIPETKTIGGVTYTVTTIGESAFFGCTGFTGSLTIPNSVNTIGNYAFYGCSGFTGGLTFGNSLETIGVGAFFECRGFNGSLTIPDSVTTIGNSAFERCSGFTGSLNISNSVTTIGSGTFNECRGFTGSLTIGNSVTTIGNYAFAWCSGFTGGLTIPNSVTTIDYSAFYGCNGFTGNLTIGNSVTTIESNAFDGCSGFTGDLIIPNSVTTIAWKAFFGCSGFTGSLAISNSVTTIGGCAFGECSGFTGSLTIPNSVTTIGNSAFNGCSGLTGSLTIPNSVTTIGSVAFFNCSGFTGNLNIPNSVDTIGWQTFSGCSGFTGNLNIPNSVTTIGNDAFYNCSGFTGSLTIPNSVNTIDFGAFANCNGFTSIQVLANTAPIVGVDYMGRDAFYGVNHAIPVTVPCGSLSSYQNATGWSDFTDIQEMCQYEIFTTVNPTGSGTTTGGGTFQQGQSCTVTATANSGYTFGSWTENGNVVSTQANYTFTVTTNRTLVANFTYNGGGNAPEGAINGLFTINANGDQVFFSQGNLQYRASSLSWRFAEHQWDYIGNDNSNISQTYSGWIDLFGWGTSGYNHGAVCYQPCSTSQTNGDYYAYGQSTYNLYDQTGKADWGYNAISNGGNTTNTWRTLTGGSNGEWNYIFDTRSTPSGIRYAKANVDGVNGIVLLPDDWSASYYSLSNTNQSNASFNSNVISSTQWNTLEQHGAVFLPAAGFRGGTSVNNVGSIGDYWSASFSNGYNAYSRYFSDSNLYPRYDSRCRGRSVRLVRSAQ